MGGDFWFPVEFFASDKSCFEALLGGSGSADGPRMCGSLAFFPAAPWLAASWAPGLEPLPAWPIPAHHRQAAALLQASPGQLLRLLCCLLAQASFRGHGPRLSMVMAAAPSLEAASTGKDLML